MFRGSEEENYQVNLLASRKENRVLATISLAPSEEKHLPKNCDHPLVRYFFSATGT